MQKISKLLINKCGIYCIVNLINGKRYVGSSNNIYSRLHEHIHNLKKNKSHNAHLQASWNKYGQNAFDYGILEYCKIENKFDREQYYINSLSPEYNLTLNVVANFGHSCTEETKTKISNTLKKRYNSGEIQTYKQNHKWKDCWVYDINSYKLLGHYNNSIEFCKAVNYLKNGIDYKRVIKNKYCIFDHKLIDSEIHNLIDKTFKKCKSSFGIYLISEKDGIFTYHRSAKDCANFVGISFSMIRKNPNCSKENPYIPTKYPNVKIYYSNEFIENDEPSI